MSVRIEEIREAAAEYFHEPTRKEIKAMSEWERAFYPTRKKGFELDAPLYVRQLLAHIDKLEKKANKAKR